RFPLLPGVQSGEQCEERRPAPHRSDRIVRSSGNSPGALDQTEFFELLEKSRAVRGEDPWCRRGVPFFGLRPSSGEDRLAGRQLADRDGCDVPGELFGELAVDLLVVLPVIADEEPADVGELGGEPTEVVCLVLASA